MALAVLAILATYTISCLGTYLEKKRIEEVDEKKIQEAIREFTLKAKEYGCKDSEIWTSLNLLQIKDLNCKELSDKMISLIIKAKYISFDNCKNLKAITNLNCKTLNIKECPNLRTISDIPRITHLFIEKGSHIPDMSAISSSLTFVHYDNSSNDQVFPDLNNLSNLGLVSVEMISDKTLEALIKSTKTCNKLNSYRFSDTSNINAVTTQFPDKTCTIIFTKFPSTQVEVPTFILNLNQNHTLQMPKEDKLNSEFLVNLRNAAAKYRFLLKFS